MVGVLLFLAVSPCCAQKVFVGTADAFGETTKHPEQWSYVREHADGLYINFVEMNHVLKHESGLSEAELTRACECFLKHKAYLESDVREPLPGIAGTGGGGAHDGASAEQEKQYINALHKAGCGVSHTSLNYGWTQDRAHNLKNFALRSEEGLRVNFVQFGPWGLNGDINGPSDKAHPNRNEKLRRDILHSDGISMDGPMGFWMTDQGKMREAVISLVRFAHAHGKQAMVMISPYGARVPSYNAERDFLTATKSVVQTLEAAHAVPDVYVVFEYATDIHAVPESVNGEPANTTMGAAYWLLRHIHERSHSP